MFELKEFVKVTSLEQADDLLNRDKKNVILGGLLWMRMGARQYHTGIDLSGLGLDRIEEKTDRIDIGAMTCLRRLETSRCLEENFGPMIRDALSSIVGVQFRNLATVGGTVFSRFSFSDLITALLVLDTRVHLHRRGSLPLADFLDASPGRDILIRLSIHKHKITTSYQCFRKSATDFPVLAAALGRGKEGWKIALGARPSRAKLALETAVHLPMVPNPVQIEAAGTSIVKELGFGSNQRGGKVYREHLAKILVKRGIKDICS